MASCHSVRDERKEEGKRRKSGGREKIKKVGKKLDPAWIQLLSTISNVPHLARY